MKRKLFFIVVFACCIKLFAASGLLAGEKDLNVVETKYFDIIYPARCEKTAAILYNNADRIFAEVTDFMCTSVEFRLPVVITPAVDQMNAFFSPMPYNHIVLFDTSVNGMEEIAVFSEQFLSVFRHELTHAVTFNMKNTFWRGVGKVFGDVVDIGYLGISTGLAESATLTSESSTGEGRLNDEYAKHVVKQAKIEGKFPNVNDVLGASTKTNVNHPYYFNGPFAQYLQDTYGREAYSQYWYYIINAQRINAFKEAFGISKETAWKLFEESYEVPDIPSNPVAANIVNDFFEKDSKEYSKYNNAGAFYTSLVSSKTRIAWLDKSCGKIYSLDNNQLTDEKIKPKKVLQITGAYSINLSNDGKYLIISSFSNSKSNVKAYVSIYDFETKQLYKIKQSGLRDGSVIYKDGEYYLVATKYETPNCIISIDKINLNKKGRIAGLERVTQITEPINTFPGKYTSLPTGEFAYILKEKLNYSICISDLHGTIIKKYSLPEKMVIHSLSLETAGSESDDNNLWFSYALPGTMPRFGKLSFEKGGLYLSQKDISGGVFTPVSNGKEIFYIGNFYEQSRLFRMSEFSEQDSVLSNLRESNDNSVDNNADNGDNLLDNGDNLFISNAKNYNPFKYYKNGIFFPASLYTTEYFGCNSGYSSVFNFSLLGATYITSNPWSFGTDDLSLFSVGYNILNSSFGIEWILFKGTITPLLTTQSDLKTEFDLNGWKQSGGYVQLSSTIPFGKISKFLLASESTARIGRQDLRIEDGNIEAVIIKSPGRLFGLTSSRTDTVYYTLSEVLSVGYSNVHKAGAGTNEKSGITVQVSAGYWYESSMDSNPVVYENEFNMNAAFTAYLPRLLPFENKIGFTNNLPTKFNIKLFPGSSHMAYQNMSSKAIGRSLIDGEVETVLFAYDIQKAFPFINGIYANNLTLSGGYASCYAIPSELTKSGFQLQYLQYYGNLINSKDIKYCDSLYLKFALALSPNIGTLSGIGMFNFYASVSFPLNYYNDNNKSKVIIGVNSGF